MRSKPSGFSAVEAVVSIAVLAVAMVGFLTAITAATKVSKEELTESDIQAQTRKLMEELTRDMDTASICFIPTWGSPNLGTPIATTDTDNASNSFLLLRYQFAVVGNDPNNPATFGQPVYPLAYGATAPGSNAATQGACYTLLFKMENGTQFIQEADPTAAPPPAVQGVRYLYKDLDGDGAYTTKFVIGHIERRFSSSYSAAAPSVTAITDSLDKIYPGLVLLEWDSASNSPKNTIFSWLENPGNGSGVDINLHPVGWQDNCYHVFSTGNNPAIIPAFDGTNPGRYPNNWVDSTGNGQWDPVLTLNLRFLVESDDGRLANSRTRMKIASTSMFMRNQNK